MRLVWYVCPVARVYGCDDIKSGVCISEHILQERDEREISWWNELLCLPVYVVASDSYTLCGGSGGPPNVGGWVGKSYFSDWTPVYLVTTYILSYFLLFLFMFTSLCFTQGRGSYQA